MMHAARLENSRRLQRTLEVLLRGGWHSTRDLIYQAKICAVNSCIAELRDPVNGFDIQTRQEGNVYLYRLVTGDAGKAAA